MRSIRFPLLCLAFLASVVVSPRMQAQDVRGHVQGVITDSSKSSIAGAEVTLTNAGTGITVSKTTSEAGVYRFDFVDPGTYTITVSQAGFSKFRQENFQVQAQGDVTIDASLTPGAVQETVDVTGSTNEVQFNTANVALPALPRHSRIRQQAQSPVRLPTDEPDSS